MKILQIINAFYPPYSSGGAAQPTYNISKQLVKRGHTLTVYTTNILDKENLFHVESNPYNINDMEVWYFRNSMYSHRNNICLSLELINSLKMNISMFDLVHIHEYRSFQNISIHHYAKKFGIPYILQARGSLPRIMSKKSLKLIYDVFLGYRLLRDATKVIALTQMEAQQYRRMGVPDEKIEVIPNGIDLSDYADLPPKGSFKEKFNIPEDKKIVLYLGRIHKIKGLDFLAKAYAHLIEKFNNVLLVVVGPDDGYLDKLRGLINSLNIADDVLLTGPLYGKDKLEAYVDADVFVLPSRYEMFGNVVLESYACSKPVVGTRVGGLQDIVFDEKTGLLVKPGDVKELYSAIFTLLNDEEARISMGIQARNVVEEKFSIEKIVDKLQETYREVLGR